MTQSYTANWFLVYLVPKQTVQWFIKLRWSWYLSHSSHQYHHPTSWLSKAIHPLILRSFLPDTNGILWMLGVKLIIYSWNSMVHFLFSKQSEKDILIILICHIVTASLRLCATCVWIRNYKFIRISVRPLSYYQAKDAPHHRKHW
jgi:hypothetical protein